MSLRAPRENFLAEFQPLGNGISLSKPRPIPVQRSQDDSEQLCIDEEPTLIILCTWLGGATARRISRYTTKYRQLLPHAQILLIQTTIQDIAARSFAQVRARLAPARSAILAAVQSADRGGYILLHIFSHGGCNTSIQLANSMRESNIGFPLQAIVFDCCPGDTSFRRAYNAMALSLPPNGLISWVGPLAVYPVVSAIAVLQSSGLMKSINELREELNDEKTFGSSAKRLYLYSKADGMVGWSDVEEHIRDAHSKGLEVRSAAFEKSPHCALIMEDSTRYWTAVKALLGKTNESRPCSKL
jgi:Eukaryotic protein of unknown function (DUF829)